MGENFDHGHTWRGDFVSLFAEFSFGKFCIGHHWVMAFERDKFGLPCWHSTRFFYFMLCFGGIFLDFLMYFLWKH